MCVVAEIVRPSVNPICQEVRALLCINGKRNKRYESRRYYTKMSMAFCTLHSLYSDPDT